MFEQKTSFIKVFIGLLIFIGGFAQPTDSTSINVAGDNSLITTSETASNLQNKDSKGATDKITMVDSSDALGRRVDITQMIAAGVGPVIAFALTNILCKNPSSGLLCVCLFDADACQY